MWQYQNTDELYHYGVLGMKWGRRNARGHAGAGIYLTKKRQLAGDKRDLEALNRGAHLSFGLTKKRQAAYDKRDREFLEKRIAKTTQELAAKQANKTKKDKYVTVRDANLNAKKAASAARKESVANDKKNLSGIGSGRKMMLNAKKAGAAARKDSIAKDAATNKSIRADKKAAKEQFKADKKIYKKLGIQSDFTIDKKGNISYDNYSIGGRKVSAEYANKVMKRVNRDSKVKVLAGTAGVMVGASAVAAILDKMTNG